MDQDARDFRIWYALYYNEPFIFARPNQDPNPGRDDTYPEVDPAVGPVGPPDRLWGGLQPYQLPGNALVWHPRRGWPHPGNGTQVPDWMVEGLGDWVYPPGLPGPNVAFHTLESEQYVDSSPAELGLTEGGLPPPHPNFFARFRHKWATAAAYECRPTAAPDAWKNRADVPANREDPTKWIKWNDFVFDKYAVEELAKPTTASGAPNPRRHPKAYQLAMDCTLTSPSHAYGFGSMKDVYFFLLHIGQPGREAIRTLSIDDPFSGPCVPHACRLLSQCPNLTRFRVGKCVRCENCRVPATAWKAWKGVRLRHKRPRHPTVGAPNVDDGAFNFGVRTVAACGQCKDKARTECVPRTKREREWARLVIVSRAARHRAARSKRHQVLFDCLNK